jgi:MFS family permease
MSLLTRALPFAPDITPLQATTYLLGTCLFSISFLVFLNSSISFVITDLLNIKDGVGDLVGTLGFADELVALVACPFWGIVSDRLGVRWVCGLGYAIVGISLVVLVQSRNVYPQLLLARMGFSLGGSATWVFPISNALRVRMARKALKLTGMIFRATMVTAILPSMTGGQREKQKGRRRERAASSVSPGLRHSIADSMDSEATITPESYISHVEGRTESQVGTISRVMPAEKPSSSPPRLAGLVGVFTGLGAILALLVFLPLPTRFSHIKNVTQGQAVADSFYVVGAIALVVAVACFFGLRNLQGEDDKGWRLLFGKPKTSHDYQPVSNGINGHANGNEGTATRPFLPYWRLLFDSTVLGFKDAQIGLGYLGGFVARASSVGISLFIPLYINAYFIRNGFCKGSPTDPSPELKKECRAAYLLSSELTGISQLIALLCAPAFGYLSDRYRRFNIPLLVASVCGVAGYTAFAQLISPEVKNVDGRGGSPVVFLIVALIGISQIGAIVCSLGLLGRGVLGDEGGYNLSAQLDQDGASNPALTSNPDTEPLLNGLSEEYPSSRSHLKGSVAGVYSLSGGGAILLLTKLGGYLFDNLSTGAPFYMMAIFNAVLLVVGIGSGLYREYRMRQLRS